MSLEICAVFPDSFLAAVERKFLFGEVAASKGEVQESLRLRTRFPEHPVDGLAGIPKHRFKTLPGKRIGRGAVVDGQGQPEILDPLGTGREPRFTGADLGSRRR